mgnify:CR=1 FL=1
MKIDELINRKRDRYIIAEISQNHDGSLGQAHAFIDAVAKAGADAIKFQTHIAEEESTPYEPFRVNFSYCDKTRYAYWKRMEFTKTQWQGLYEHALDVGLDFLSSPFSVKALEMLDEIGIPAWKFGSGEVFNSVLLKKAISTKKPILISTGLSTLKDIDKIALEIKNAGNPLIIMECTTAYPSKAENIPIKLIQILQERYGCIVGISDHSATVFPALAAATLGASVTEVHVTMSREMFGPDIKASVTLEELSEIVRGVDFINKMICSAANKERLSKEQQELKKMFSKSIYANREIVLGEIISTDMLAIKKPYDSRSIPVEDFEKIHGLKCRTEIAKNQIITWEDLEQ